MAREWTPNQSAAIEEMERDVCVAAGAGSGKTGVLVERFIRIVRESAAGRLPASLSTGVGGILVITFTEKATREMKERIVCELERAGLAEERRQIETAYISTIHGLCSRLLKENPFEAGVDPQFRVLEENEARRLLREAFERVVERGFRDDDEQIVELAAAAQNERVFGLDGGDPLAALAAAVEGVLAALRGAGRRMAELDDALTTGPKGASERSLAPVLAWVAPMFEEVRRCAAGAAALPGSGYSAAEPARRRLADIAAALPRPAEPDIDRIVEAVGLVKEAGARAAGMGRRRAGLSDDDAALDSLLVRLRQAAESGAALQGVSREREEQAALLCHRFAVAVARTWRDYAVAKRAAGVLDNDDLQAEAVRLLDERPEVRRRCRARFRWLLVDEFQDTNSLQMRLVSLLHEPSFGGPEEAPNRLFIVGDAQQSIYAFRNAEPRLFRDLERLHRGEASRSHVTMADNFRARPEVLALVNHLFGRIWRGEGVAFTPLRPMASYAPKEEPSIELMVGAAAPRGEAVAAEADAIAGRIADMVRGQRPTVTAKESPRAGEPIRFGDVAVLMRTLSHIETYERAFARAGIPYFVVGGGRGYYARFEIRDVLNVLTVLDAPLDDVALVATLRSPLVGLEITTIHALARHAREAAGKGARALYPAIPSFCGAGQGPLEDLAALAAFHALMEGLRREEDRLPVGMLLERIVAATDYDARLLVRPNGRRRLANLRKLLQMAHAEPRHGVTPFVRRLRELEKISEREGDAPTEEEAANVVRLITIHKAKGLEFPVVFLADMSRGLRHLERGIFVCDPAALAFGCKLADYASAAHRAIARRREQRDAEEANRVLYVALTRAREHLVLCGSPRGRPGAPTWADIVFSTLGVLGPPSAPEVRRVADIDIRVTAITHGESAA
ncbi:MAG: UvrD-helicase domain-containing protein [Chthonomonadales bacterium]|nr:UvrD-helicase domain-containing protein [Chthonomonadales bacterium]